MRKDESNESINISMSGMFINRTHSGMVVRSPCSFILFESRLSTPEFSDHQEQVLPCSDDVCLSSRQARNVRVSTRLWCITRGALLLNIHLHITFNRNDVNML